MGVKALCNLSQLPLERDWFQEDSEQYHYMVMLLNTNKSNGMCLYNSIYRDISPYKSFMPITYPIKIKYDDYNRVEAFDKEEEKLFLEKLKDKGYIDVVCKNYQELIERIDLSSDYYEQLYRGKPKDLDISYTFINKKFWENLKEEAKDSETNLFDRNNYYAQKVNFYKEYTERIQDIENTVKELVNLGKDDSRYREVQFNLRQRLEQGWDRLFLKESLQTPMYMENTLLMTSYYELVSELGFDIRYLDEYNINKLKWYFENTTQPTIFYGKNMHLEKIIDYYLLNDYASYVGTVFNKARYEDSELSSTEVLKEHLNRVMNTITEYEEAEG